MNYDSQSIALLGDLVYNTHQSLPNIDAKGKCGPDVCHVSTNGKANGHECRPEVDWQHVARPSASEKACL